jgi:hypothetical protein
VTFNNIFEKQFELVKILSEIFLHFRECSDFRENEKKFRFSPTSNPIFYTQSDLDYTLTVATYRTRIILMCCVSQLLALLTIFTFLGTTCDTIPYVGINHFTAHTDEGWVGKP